MRRDPRLGEDIFELIADIVIAKQAKWREKAACKEESKTHFFGHNGIAPDGAIAKQICSTCTVTQECRDDFKEMTSAMQGHGVWFGTTPRDRRISRR